MPHERLLSELRKGESGRVVRVGASPTSLRLMEMGIVPGAFVSIQSVSPFGNPIAIRVANYTLSIRREDAGDVVLAEY